MSSTGRDITLRPAEARDRDLLLDWANEPATRAASFHPALIDPAAHDRWFADHLVSSDVGIWIGELDGRPVGQVRVVRTDRVHGEVSISLAAEARGRGLSRPLLLAAMAAAERQLGVTAFVAAVRPGNAASLALFRGAGYSDESDGERDGVPCAVLARPAESLSSRMDVGRGRSGRPRLNVLITSASRKVPLVQGFMAATASLGGRVIAADVSPLAAALYEAHAARLVPHSDDAGFVDALLELCASEDIGLVVPTRDEELPVLAAARDRFAAVGTLVLVSEPAAVDRCQDKVLFADAVVAAGLETPYTFRDRNHMIFPAFVKPRRGKGGSGAVRVDDRAGLAAALARAGADAIIQELVEAPEFTIDTFLDLEGRAITCVPRERIAVVDGESVLSRTVRDPGLVEATLRLCGAIGLVGQVTVQAFRAGGRVLFIEVNPRYGGAASLSIAAGAGTPELALQLARGESLVPQLDAYEVGLIMLRSSSDRFMRDPDLIDGDSAARPAPVRASGASAENAMPRPDVVPVPGRARWPAVLFDLDDTLYSEHEFVDGGFRAAAAVLARELDRPVEFLVERLWALHRRDGRGGLFDTLLEELGRAQDPELVLACLHAYRTHSPHVALFPGMPDLIAQLQRRAVRLGVVSDGQSAVQHRKLAALDGVARRLAAVVMTDELGPGHAKPSPDGFRLACRILGVQPRDAVYVANDVRKDFRGAREAGLATIRFGSQPDEGGGVDSTPPSADDSDLVADSVDELAAILFAVGDRDEPEVPDR